MAIAIAMHCGAYKNLDLYLCWLEIVFHFSNEHREKLSNKAHVWEEGSWSFFLL